MNIPNVRASVWVSAYDSAQTPNNSPRYEYNAAIDTFVPVRANTPASPSQSPPKHDKVGAFLDWIGGKQPAAASETKPLCDKL
jgi:hypothetical protein